MANSYANTETVNAFSKTGKESKGIPAKTAVVGIMGVKKFFYML
ncbi:MAG: hypothetical protein ACFFAS_02895 [Promethearchaeota archaeon]